MHLVSSKLAWDFDASSFQQACFEDGVRLSTPKRMHDRLIVPGTQCAGKIRWTYTYAGGHVETVSYSAAFTGENEGWLRQLGRK